MIPGMDHNEDVRTGPLAVKLQELGMIDSILTLYSASPPPAIFNRNKTRTPIDALWVSPNVGVVQGWYCAFCGSIGM